VVRHNGVAEFLLFFGVCAFHIPSDDWGSEPTSVTSDYQALGYSREKEFSCKCKNENGAVKNIMSDC